MKGAAPVKVDARSNTINGAVNIALALSYAAIHLLQCFLLPLWLMPQDKRWAWLLLPLALLNNPYWSLLHEAIHDLFHPKRAVNSAFGRIVSVLFGSPFPVLRLSHLLHHKLNRTLQEATDPYEPGTVSWARAAWGYYFQILGGLYLGELMSSILFFLPKRLLRQYTARRVAADSVSGILLNNWLQDGVLHEIRTDGFLIVAMLGAAFYCYGEHWPLLVGVLAARALLISFLDNVYHYRTPINELFYAHNLWLPKFAEKCLLNFNLHGIHHRNPAIPWNRLPALFHGTNAAYQGDYFFAAVAQLRGPIAVGELKTGLPVR